MKIENMQHIVVLKNLPSNIIEEAFVILKPNLKVKEVNGIKKESEYLNCEKKKKPKEYIIKEAELLVSDYLNGMERKKEEKKQKEIEKRYKKLKKICTILTFIIFISMRVHFL